MDVDHLIQLGQGGMQRRTVVEVPRVTLGVATWVMEDDLPLQRLLPGPIVGHAFVAVTKEKQEIIKNFPSENLYAIKFKY